MEKNTAKFEEHKITDLFSGVRGLAVKILNRIERTDSYLDKLLDYELRQYELSPADKALLYEIVHGVARWMGRLDWILSGFYKGQFSKAIPVLKNALRVALYQILFLDKVPEFAAVNEAVEFVKKLHGQKPADITNAVLRNIVRSKNNIRYPDPDENLIGYLAAYHSHPSWLAKRWLARFGREEAELLMAANNERPFITLRVNQLRVSKEEFNALLATVNLKYTQGKYLPDYYKLQNLSNITNWEYFTAGYFNIQDESAGLPCQLLGAQQGMRVLDLCAAPGGKSAYLADIMANTGHITAVDIFDTRLQRLQENLDRLGISIVHPVAADALTFTDEQLYDRVLTDVPCSGLGTLSKKPDIKWKKELIDIHRLTKMQYALLEKGASLVKPGGRVVYSTCTTEPEENGEIVFKFLAEHPEFRLINAAEQVPAEVVDSTGCIQTLPHKHKTDGAFAALLERTQ